MRRIEIDLNSRDSRGYTPARYVGTTPRIEDRVVVFEREDHVCADAVVVDVDDDNCRVTLAVDWSSLRDDNPMPTVASGGTTGMLGTGGSSIGYVMQYPVAV